MKRLAVFTAHPQANGLVERYNRVLKEGLRKLAYNGRGQPWPELLPGVLAGLRFLPTRVGYPPAWIAYK